MEKSVGLDLGYGNIKTYNGVSSITPAYAYPAIRGSLGLSINGETDDTALVGWNGYAYHVGQYAAYKGVGSGASFGFDRLVAGGAEIKALFYRAMAAHEGEPTKRAKTVALWCAMPVEAMIGGKDKETAEALRSWLLGDHEWTVNDEPYRLNVSKVVTIPQPVAALFDYALDGSGKPLASTSTDITGRMLFGSIGMNTFEMLGFDGQRIVDKQTGGPKNGVRLLIDLIAAQTGDEFAVADAKLRSGLIEEDVLNQSINKYWGIVRQSINAQWGDSWRNAKKVVMVGGGVLLLRDQLQSFFGSKLFVPKDDKHPGAIISIARGIYKRSLVNG